MQSVSKVRLSVMSARTKVNNAFEHALTPGNRTDADIIRSAYSRAFCVPVSMLDDVSSSTTGRKTGHAVDGFWRDVIARQGDFDRVPKDHKVWRCSTTYPKHPMPWLRKAGDAKSTLLTGLALLRPSTVHTESRY